MVGDVIFAEQTPMADISGDKALLRGISVTKSGFVRNRSGASVLEAVGVSAPDEAVYRELLREPRATTGELAQRMRKDVTTVRRSVARLEQLGLVARTPGHPPRLLPARPDVAVDVLVARHREELTGAQLAARALLADMVVDEERRPDRLVEVVVGRAAIATRFEQLVCGVEKELLVFDRPPYVSNAGRSGSAVRSLLGSGIAVRGVYAPESLELPGALDEARDSARAGEQSRVHPDVPMKLAIADRRLALLPLNAGDQDMTTGTALVIHPCALLKAVHALFELMWASAVPIFAAAAASPVSADHAALLTALAAGLKDDAIARQLGASTRTVRRRIADVTDALRARTRFQAGVLAERRGLLHPR
jgi:predicted DNA-binding transcriptional regulator